MSNLFIDKFPELVKEWNYDMNIDIDISKITFSSHKKVYWKCDKGHVYLASLNNRTKKNKNSKCLKCSTELKRIHNIDDVNKKIYNYKPVINTTLIGDESEIYILNLLLNKNIYKDVKRLGNMGSNADISITHFDDTINYIQIKTITKILNNKDSYYYTNDHKYPDNMLIVMLNKSKDRFALEFHSNIKVKRLSLSYDYKKSKYKDIMFTDLNIFFKKLIELIPMSTRINNIYSCISKEIASLYRFEKFCKTNNIDYKRNITNGNTIDGTINNFNFQEKFISKNYKNRLTYMITSSKSAGRLNNKNIKRPYSENDFDYIIIEIGGTISSPNKYLNNFCIIPKNILIEQNILQTDTCKGKKKFYICAPDCKKPHWSKNLWNNISFL